jgi:hypothetical protein
MEKLDLRQRYQSLYAPSARQVSLVDVPALTFLMLDGAIEPGEAPGTSPAFAEATQALYGVSYALKFKARQRRDNPFDYAVMPLEGLWWIEEGTFDIARPGNWLWTLMILQPEPVTPEMVAEALSQARRKKPGPALDRLRFAPFQEGLCVQTLHVGPYAAEPATVARLEAFMAENGLRGRLGRGGKHHEIYLGDPRRADPARLKTILRHPVERIVGV